MTSVNVKDEKFVFNNHDILIVFDDDENVWFRGKDIAIIMGYKKTEKAVTSHVSKSNRKTYGGLKENISDDLLDIHPQTVFINELGLYSFIMNSKMAIKEELQNWFHKEVLHAIRDQRIIQPLKKENELFKKIIESSKIQQVFCVLESDDNEETFEKHRKRVYKCIDTQVRYLEKAEQKAKDEGFENRYECEYMGRGGDVITRIEKVMKEKGVKYDIDRSNITVYGDFDFIRAVKKIIEDVGEW